MSVLRPRNRIVNFRVSEDELERMKEQCKLSGHRSISDFARSSVLDSTLLSRIEENTRRASPLSELSVIAQKLDDIAKAIYWLSCARQEEENKSRMLGIKNMGNS